MSYVLHISIKNTEQGISIPFDTMDREPIVREHAMRVISYVQGKISQEELDEDNLCPEILATMSALN